MVAQAVFLKIGVVGMRGAKQLTHVVVVVGVLVGIAYDKTNGRTRRQSFEDATEQLHLVSFLPLCGNAALTWPAA